MAAGVPVSETELVPLFATPPRPTPPVTLVLTEIVPWAAVKVTRSVTGA